MQKTVELLTEQKQKTTDRLAKIQSENSDLKSRYVHRRWLSVFRTSSLDYWHWKIDFTILKDNRHVHLEPNSRNTSIISSVLPCCASLCHTRVVRFRIRKIDPFLKRKKFSKPGNQYALAIFANHFSSTAICLFSSVMRSIIWKKTTFEK